MKIHLLVKTVLLLSLYILPLPHRSCLLLSLRKHQFLLALRRWERFAAKSEEKQMFSHATYVCSQSRCCKEWTIIQHPAKSGLLIFVMVKIFVFDCKSHVITYRVRVRFEEITSTCMISDPNCTTRNSITILLQSF